MTLSGAGFVTVGPNLPTVRVGKLALVPDSAEGCEKIAGTLLDAKSCSTLTVTLPKDALDPGMYEVTVTNPDPAGCVSTEPVTLVVAAAPTVTSVAPDLICTAEGGASITVTGTGFLTVGGVLPTVRLGDTVSLVAGVLYTQPESHVKQTDPRLTAGAYRTDAVQRQFIFTLGPLWRFLARSKGLNGYVLAGLQMYVLQTVITGSSGGQAFGTNREVSVQAGGVLEVAGEYGIGPGAVTLSLDFAGARLPHVITGKVADLTILIAAGYRFFF